MKKGMLVMTIFVALSFLVSLCAVAPAVAKQATQTTPTTKQQGPAQTPVAQQLPKAAFWDLGIDHFIVNGQSFPFVNDFNQAKIINVTVGQAINCQCVYKIKTIPVGTITEADAKAWGAGNLSYKFAIGPFFPGPPSHQEYHIGQLNLPKFTYADVQNWKAAIGASGRNEWTVTIPHSWTAAQEHVGKTMYLHFDVDSFFNIKETDENNNGSFGATGCLAKIIVTPASLKDMPKQKLEKNK
jgi:hypothetical protein